MTGFSPFVFGREEEGLAPVQSSLPAVTCRIIVKCPIFCSIHPARKARMAVCPVIAACGLSVLWPRLRHHARFKRAHFFCPVDETTGFKLNLVMNPAIWPKALLKPSGLDQTDSQLAADTTPTGMKQRWHHCREIENQRPKNDPVIPARHSFMVSFSGADEITLEGRFWGCNRGICKMGA